MSDIFNLRIDDAIGYTRPDVVIDKILKIMRKTGSITLTDIYNICGHPELITEDSYLFGWDRARCHDDHIDCIYMDFPYIIMPKPERLAKAAEKSVPKPSHGDSIMHPDHYAAGRKYEPVKVIEDWNLNFNLGNVVKYVSRADRKGDALKDLRKAKTYLEFEISRREKNYLNSNFGVESIKNKETGSQEKH